MGWGTVGLLVVVVALLAVLGARLAFATSGPSWRRRRQREGDAMLFEACKKRPWARTRALNRRLPRAPRCTLCYAPFRGVGWVVGVKPSQKNPRFCLSCFEMLPEGAHEVEVGVLFLRSDRASDSRPALWSRDAIVSDVDGGGLVALFLPQFPSLHGRVADVMVEAALELAEGPRSDAAIALHLDVASVGNVVRGDAKDFGAEGEALDTAVQLCDVAKSGEIVASGSVFDRLDTRREVKGTPLAVTIRGKRDALVAYSLVS